MLGIGFDFWSMTMFCILAATASGFIWLSRRCLTPRPRLATALLPDAGTRQPTPRMTSTPLPPSLRAPSPPEPREQAWHACLGPAPP